MKKLLLLTAGMIFCAGIYSQIPNAGFESWSTHSINVPASWSFVLGNVSKVSPGYNSNYAVRLEADTIGGNPGVVLNGYSSNGMDFGGGIPFAYKPDSVNGYFKYSIQAGDSANILVILKKAGTVLAFNWFPIKGTHTNDFIKLAFKINYIDNITTPDSLIIGIASTLGNTDHNKGYIIADNISLTGINFTIPGGDFETWTTKGYDEPDGWATINAQAYMRGMPMPVTKTSDKYDGQSAALIQNYIVGTDTVFGILSTGQINNWNRPAFPMLDKFDFLSGYFKFLPQNNDSMMIAVQLFKNHNTIGWGSFVNGDAQNTYVPFKVNLNYGGNNAPDSATIIISSFWSQKNGRPRGNTKLYLDGLAFGNEIGIAKNPVSPENNMNVYPNPVNKSSVIRYQLSEQCNVMIELFDITGQKIKTIIDSRQNPGSYSLNFNRQNLASGIYQLKLSTITTDSKLGTQASQYKRIVIE